MINTNEYTRNTFTVLVDETRMVEEVLKSIKFDFKNDNLVSEYFPTPKGGKKTEKEILFFQFGTNMSSQEIISEMDKTGYKPATVWDLLSLPLEDFVFQKELPMVALGSISEIDGCNSVVSINKYPSFFRLNLCRMDRQWLVYYKTFSQDLCLDLEDVRKIWTKRYKFAGVRK